MTSGAGLFDEPPVTPPSGASSSAPLAERARPKSLDEVTGQEHLLGPGAPIRSFLETGFIPSIIFWGPPGCGKTTLARLISSSVGADFYQLSAVSSGVGEVRTVIARAAAGKKAGRASLLFIDEIHRFNKAQQDALLHSVENGTLTLIGATTENPSFEVISPLLSRCTVCVLRPLEPAHLAAILDRALEVDPAMSKRPVVMAPDVRNLLTDYAAGDARQLLNGVEAAVALARRRTGEEGNRVTVEDVRTAFQRKRPLYDKSGEEHYNIISAFIKSVRGSDPDAALHWLARMIEGGEDPLFIARRMIVLASEDIGNADPAALPLAAACFTAVDSIGMPEARIVLSQTAVYLAAAPKSNAAITAIEEALEDIRRGAAGSAGAAGSDSPAGSTGSSGAVPLHLRNAPTSMMKDQGYGKGYLYPHAYPGNFTPQEYLPEGLKDKVYYRPTDNGDEKRLRERLNALWKGRQR